MKKILTITTILAITLVLCVAPVFAANTATGTVVKVEDITNEDSLHNETGEPKVDVALTEGVNADTVVVTYSAADLKIVDKDKDGESRPMDAAWLGVRLTPVSDGTYSYFSCSIVSKAEIEDNEGKSVDYYVPVTPEKLEEAVLGGKDLVYTDTIKWLTDESANEEEAPVTNLTVIVKADQMKIYDKEDNEEQWNEESYEAAVAAREEAKKAESEKTEEPKKDETPKTGVVDYLPVLGIVAVVSLAGAVVLKRN